jgi:glycosyltransferase involved in cell wall biosynthesis
LDVLILRARLAGTICSIPCRGSVPEILQEGVSGFVVDNVSGAVQAVQRIALIDRRRCRQAFEQRFTTQRMVYDYMDLFSQVLEERWRTLHVAAQSVS